MPAVPQPLRRRPAVRAGRRAVRVRRRRRELQQRRLRPVRRDHRQSPTPKNPCGDPPAGSAGPRRRRPRVAARSAPRASAAGRRAGRPQRRGPPGRPGDRRRPAEQPALSRARDANARRIVAYGFRNPFRFTIRPGTNELWIGDVGWNDWEEIDRIVDPLAATVANGGWPCYEGNGQQSGYQSAGLDSVHQPLRHADRAADAVLHLQPRLAGRARRGLPVGQLVDLRDGVLPGRQLPGVLHERPVLRRPLAQLHLVHARGQQRPARQDPDLDVHLDARRTRSTSRRARTATSSTSTSRAANIHRVTYTPATRHRRP